MIMCWDRISSTWKLARVLAGSIAAIVVRGAITRELVRSGGAVELVHTRLLGLPVLKNKHPRQHC